MTNSPAFCTSAFGLIDADRRTSSDCGGGSENGKKD
jgi:hypothetical protein